MFFEKCDFAVNVIDVLEFNQQKKVVVPTKARNFWAISYRHNAETYFKTGHKTIEALSKSIAIFPAGLNYTRVARNENMTVVHFIPTINLGDEIKVFYPENYVEYEKCFDRIFKVWQRKDIAYNIKCNEYLTRLIYMICCEQTNLQNENIAKVCARQIERNISNFEFCVGNIPDNMDISGVYLRKKFKEEYGISPLEYLTEKRMEKAAALLETNYFSVKEIAKRCGFENEKYFSTVFKKHFGVSPSKF
ncbi:MAG: helix-turn-helix domain-containing protein [Ruminococcaceae bacterium]|nr:helix-turn-helix domain-containing protein [Oscillospiraceae bacterium]